MLYVCWPKLSSWEPEAVVGATTLHVGEGCSKLVAGQLGIALSTTTMSTGAMGPTICARSRSTSVASIGVAIVIAGVGAVVGVMSVEVVVVVAVVVGWASPDGGHHLLHLGHESSFASGKGGFMLEDGGIGNISGSNSGSNSNGGFVRRGHSIEETLGNKIGNGDDGVGMIGWLLMENVTSSGKGAEVELSFAKMGEHVGPGAVSNR
jgi:hypothetical protein